MPRRHCAAGGRLRGRGRAAGLARGAAVRSGRRRERGAALAAGQRCRAPAPALVVDGLRVARWRLGLAAALIRWWPRRRLRQERFRRWPRRRPPQPAAAGGGAATARVAVRDAAARRDDAPAGWLWPTGAQHGTERAGHASEDASTAAAAPRRSGGGMATEASNSAHNQHRPAAHDGLRSSGAPSAGAVARITTAPGNPRFPPRQSVYKLTAP